jgi:hypothetical protein
MWNRQPEGQAWHIRPSKPPSKLVTRSVLGDESRTAQAIAHLITHAAAAYFWRMSSVSNVELMQPNPTPLKPNQTEPRPLTACVMPGPAGPKPLLEAMEPSVGVGLRGGRAVPTTPAQMVT